jgi:two-component system, OmpR family, sensor kinase
MKSLFLRIFLSFWLTMGLIVVAGVTVTAFFTWRSFESLQKIEMSDVADVANKILQERGVDGLRKWLAYSQDHDYMSISTYIVDMYGHDIAGQSLSDRIDRRVKRMQVGGYLADAAGNPPPLMPDPLRSTP